MPVLQDDGLLLLQAMIFAQKRGIARPELDDRLIHQPAPLRCAAADDVKIGGTEQDRGERAVQLRRRLFDAVDPDLLALSLPQLDLYGLVASVRGDVRKDLRAGVVKADQLPVEARAEAAAAREQVHGLQQIRLPLRVFAGDDVDAG